MAGALHFPLAPLSSSDTIFRAKPSFHLSTSSISYNRSFLPHNKRRFLSLFSSPTVRYSVRASLSSSSSDRSSPKTKLYVSGTIMQSLKGVFPKDLTAADYSFYFHHKRCSLEGLSFRTTEDSLRNAFQNFGKLVEVNLVMDKIANRPRGFAFLRYETEEESQKAIEGMHGKFLDGRVIFVEVAKPRSEVRKGHKQSPRPF